MLPANLLIVSMVVFLATSISTAPVEEKEREEVEVEAREEGEGELSEEEEDDDDSKSQDKFEGVHGVQPTSAAASGGSASGGHSAAGGRDDGAAGAPAGDGGFSPSLDSAGSAGFPGAAGSPGAGQTQGAARPAASSHTETDGSDGVDSESTGNGHKLLNGGGGGGGGADSQTGIGDPAGHDFLLGLMGGGEAFGPDLHINVPGLNALGHMTPPTQPDSTGIGSGVTAAPSADLTGGSGPDSPADPVHQSGTGIDQSGLDHMSQSSGPDQSQPSSSSGSSHSAAQEAEAASSSSSHAEAHRDRTDAGDAPDANGSGRQTLLTDKNGGLVSAASERPVSLSDVRTDLPGGAESVTGHVDLTAFPASGLGLGHDVTDSTPVIVHTESTDVMTLDSVSGVYSHTDLVTAATDSTATDKADPTGSPPESSHPAVTDHAQVAGSVTEQYNPSGQGPEGAENVELEDTC